MVGYLEMSFCLFFESCCTLCDAFYGDCFLVRDESGLLEAEDLVDITTGLVGVSYIGSFMYSDSSFLAFSRDANPTLNELIRVVML